MSESGNNNAPVDEQQDVDMLSSDDSSNSSLEVIVQHEGAKKLDDHFDMDTFTCLPNGGPHTMPKDSPDYEQIKAEFENLFQMRDPSFSVENYKQFITMAMTLDDLKAIRKACEEYCAKFTYDESVVLSWLYRELREFNATGEKEILDYMFDNIFVKALEERYSRLLVYKLAQFSKIHPDREKIWTLIFDKYFYDFVSPTKLFSVWIEGVDRNAPENRQEIVKRYEKLISIPHIDMDKSYIDFKVLAHKEGDNYKVDNWDYVLEDFEKSQFEADLMVAYENELDFATDENRATMYKLYLKEVGDKLNRKVRRFLYERMVAECSEDSSCWLSYLKYLQSRWYDEKDDIDIENLLNRAIRLSDPHEEFFISKMLLIERKYKSSPDFRPELTKVIEKALEISFKDADPITKIWLEYLTITTRNTKFDSEKEVEILRKNFDLSWDSLSKQWGDAADRNGEILKLQARLEYQKLNNAPQGRDLWNMVLSFGENSQKAGVWMEYIALEEATNHNTARKLYKRALHIPELLDPDTIASAWTRFERVYGDQKQLSYCMNHCNEVLEKYYKQFEEENRRAEQDQAKQDPSKPQKKDMKRKPTERDAKDKNAKRQKNDEFQKPAPVRAPKPKTDQPKRDAKPPKQPNNTNTEQTTPTERDTTKDHLRVFMSNLDYNVTEEIIKETFPELDIKAIDMVMGPTGKSRGFCFVELGSEEKVKEALEFDRRPINGRPTYVSNVSRDKTNREKKFSFIQGLEPTKLFVKGCGNSTQNELEAAFKPFGSLKEIRLVYHKSGKAKGIAFVEFENEADAKRAVMQMDGFEINGQNLSVSLSCPPPRQPVAPPASKIESLGNAKRLTGIGEKKPRLSFIPSSVLKKAT